jgi:hypothetical protein
MSCGQLAVLKLKVSVMSLALTLAIYFGGGLMLVSTPTSFAQAEGEHGVLSSDSNSDSFVDSSYLFLVMASCSCRQLLAVLKLKVSMVS